MNANEPVSPAQRVQPGLSAGSKLATVAKVAYGLSGVGLLVAFLVHLGAEAPAPVTRPASVAPSTSGQVPTAAVAPSGGLPAAPPATTAAEPKPAPPDPSDAIIPYIPAAAGDYLLVAVVRYPKVLPGVPDQPQTGLWATYWSTRPDRTTIELLVNRSSERASGDRQVKLGKVSGMLTPAPDIAVTWRAGAMACVAWVTDRKATDDASAERRALQFAKSVAAWTTDASVGKVPAKGSEGVTAKVKSLIAPAEFERRRAAERHRDLLEREEKRREHRFGSDE